MLLVGTGVNGALGPSTGSAAIAQWFKIRRSFALGIYFTGSGGAGLVLIPFMSALTETYGWRVSAASLGATTLLLTAVVAPFMRHKPEASPSSTLEAGLLRTSQRRGVRRSEFQPVAPIAHTAAASRARIHIGRGAAPLTILAVHHGHLPPLFRYGHHPGAPDAAYAVTEAWSL